LQKPFTYQNVGDGIVRLMVKVPPRAGG